MTAPELVFLHIPKTAGTSQHRSFLQYYGRDNIYWIGDDCPGDVRVYPAREVGERFLVGGHKPLSFYPRRLDALFCAILRDPVQRAISLYSYYTQPELAQTEYARQTRAEILERMQKQGMNPDSMLDSIRQCQPFRREISNMQCAYVSRSRRTFEGALQGLRKHDFVLGSMRDYQRFHRYLGELLEWPDEEPGALNLSKANYESAYIEDNELVALLRELNTEDYKLTEFLSREYDDLYVNLSNRSRRLRRLRRLVMKPWMTRLARSDWQQVARRYWPAREGNGAYGLLGQVMVSESAGLLYVSIPGPADPLVKRLMLESSAIPHQDAALGLGLGRVASNFKTGLMLQDYSETRIREILEDPRFFRFAMLRDPVTRLVDVYVQKFVLNRGDLARTPRLAGLVRLFNAAAGDQLEQSISFREFLAGVLHQKPDEQHPLWAPQSHYLGAVGGCDRLYRQDRVDELSHDLMQLRGIPRDVLQHSKPLPVGGLLAGESSVSDGKYADSRPDALPQDSSLWRDRLVDSVVTAQILACYAQDRDLYNGMADKGKLVVNP